MTKRLSLGWRLLFAAALATILLLPLAGQTALAQTSAVGRATDGDDGDTGLGSPMSKLSANQAGVPAPRRFARINYAWPFSTGPNYGTLDRAPGVVYMTSGAFDLSAGPLNLPAELRAVDRVEEGGAQYFVIALHPEADSEIAVQQIASVGGQRMRGLPNNSFLARLTKPSLEVARTALGVVAVEPYHPAFKLHPMIGRAPLRDPARAASEVYTLTLRLFAGEDASVVAGRVAELGGSVRSVTSDTLIVDMNRFKLDALASLEPVAQIFELHGFYPHGEETTTTMQTGSYNGGDIPYHDAGIDGSGGGVGAATAQVIMVLDSGFSVDAGDLSHTKTISGWTGTGTNVIAGHRKVIRYESTTQFGLGGKGDLESCDAPENASYTHGHIAAAIAVGNATNIDAAYDPGETGFQGEDPLGGQWNMDGVAPGAKLVAYDAAITPPSIGCDDPQQLGVDPGNLYTSPSGGSLGESYTNDGAKIANFSWGGPEPVYDIWSDQIDQFLFDKKDAMVFTSAGNTGADDSPDDGIPDPGSIGNPSGFKNGLAIGASFNASLGALPENRAGFSSVGPAIDDSVVNRIAPQLMAPGADVDSTFVGSLGLQAAYVCRSQRNDQTESVLCDVSSGPRNQGTSFSSPAAAGAALLVRDYFAQGFYPDATTTDAGNTADQLAGANISGALVKAMLVASANFMSLGNLSHDYRANNEQGWGRIQLDKVLPLETYPASPTGLIVHDSIGGASDLTLPATIAVNVADSASATFAVCDDQQELRVALTWIEPPGQQLLNDLDLTITAPGGLISYQGNYFTDDANRNGVLDPGEDCPSNDEEPHPGTTPDDSRFSLATCANTGFPFTDTGSGFTTTTADRRNTIEMIVLSPDPKFDNIEDDTDTGIDEGDDNQLLGLTGNWTITISSPGGSTNGPTQDFAVAIAGGVCLGSSVRLLKEDEDGNKVAGDYTCNEEAIIRITELSEAGDLTPDVDTTKARTTVEVLDGVTGLVVDTETDLEFTQPDPSALIFEYDAINLSDQTFRDDNNGVLDVRSGDKLRVTYDDVGAPRINTANVNCDVEIGVGSITFGQFGQDISVFVQGGCERNALGRFEFGFPDRYMDAGETLQFLFAFNSLESEDLTDVVASLRCVHVDANSPEDCLPGGPGCGPTDDPRRLDNASCDGSGSIVGTHHLTILDSPKSIGLLPSLAAQTANFNIQMDETIVGTPTVELLLELSSASSGKTASGLAVSRHTLDVDKDGTLYSTDFPLGGTDLVVFDYPANNRTAGDEVAADPSESLIFEEHYRFETKSYGNLTTGLDASGAAVSVNGGLLSPWNFDGNNGGFVSGLNPTTDKDLVADSISIWGEDKNFNGVQDGVCNSNPAAACFVPDGIDNGCASCAGLTATPCNRCEGGIYDGDLGCSVDADCPGTDGPPVVPAGTCESAISDRLCNAEEDPNGSKTFEQNWNTRGGCGWQTKPLHVCAIDTDRGCFTNTDCLGVCKNAVFPANTTFDPCDDNGDCTAAFESCIDFAGTCDLGSTAPGGGVWHTGEIGDFGDNCEEDSPCARYTPISGIQETGAPRLRWLETLLTPVMEKVNQSVDGNGDNVATIEITGWQWNQAVDLADDLVRYAWEFDTDVDKLLPLDNVADGDFFNSGAGSFGAVSGGSNPDLTDGYSMFATVSTCSIDGTPCLKDGDCPSPQTCVYTAAGVTTNGTVGNNRSGQNSCYFEGPGKILDVNTDRLGFAKPLDDDQDNDGDALFDEYVKANGPIRNAGINDYNGLDLRAGTFEDLYGETGNRFQGAITFINLQAPTGDDDPAAQAYGLAIDDMEVEWEEFTLVDDATDCASGGSCAVVEIDTGGVYTSSSIIGITVLDQFPYGEDGVNDCNSDGDFTDGDDDTDCDNNGTDDVIVNVSSEVEPLGENLACNSTGIAYQYYCEISTSTTVNTVGVLFLSQNAGSEPTVAARYQDLWDGRGIRVCAIPTSGLCDLGANDGLPCNVAADCPDGTCVPTGVPDNAGFVCTDDGDCTSSTCELSVCQNAVDPNLWGIVETATTVFVPACVVSVSGVSFVDNGDNDDFGDTNETLDVHLNYTNSCGTDLTNCIARLASNSPEVDCITDGIINLGDLPEDATVNSSTLDGGAGDGFSFKVADVNRTNVFTDLTADFTATLSCDQIDGTVSLQQFSVTLDLDLLSSATCLGGTNNGLLCDEQADCPGGECDGQDPWAESFESANPASAGDFASFEADNIDAGIPPTGLETDGDALARADGMRCQYSDPDNPDTVVFGTNNAPGCYPGYNPNHADTHYWQINGDGDTCGADSGRAYDGERSLYFGICLNITDGYTTPSGQIEGVKSILPINLGVGSPEFSFKHQISLMRAPEQGGAINAISGTTADRGIVSLQLAGDFCDGGANDGDGCDGPVDCPGGTCATDVGTGPWIKLKPFKNDYAMTNYKYYNSCMFDPVDDGSNEDDYFNAANPLDSEGYVKGPSSTCDPELIWAGMGDTDEAFDEENVQNGDLGSGLEGNRGFETAELSSGTWVESAIDLSEFRGRRVRLRFLTTGLKATLETWEAQFSPLNPHPSDDGWFIDDLQIDDTLEDPAIFLIDTNPNQVVSDGGTFPECGTVCELVTMMTTTDPDPATLPSPGQTLEIDAADSFADRCLSGTLQYRFSTAGGQELRGWTDNPVILVAPAFTTNYVIEARCSSLTSCAASTNVIATVNCPASVVTPTAFGDTIFAEANKNEFAWAYSCNGGANDTLACDPSLDLSAECPGAGTSCDADSGTTKAYAAYTGDLSVVSSYTGAFISNGVSHSFVDSATPSGGTGFYYVVRNGQFCNDAGLWTSGGSGEETARETTLP